MNTSCQATIHTQVPARYIRATKSPAAPSSRAFVAIMGGDAYVALLRPQFGVFEAQRSRWSVSCSHIGTELSVMASGLSAPVFRSTSVSRSMTDSYPLSCAHSCTAFGTSGPAFIRSFVPHFPPSLLYHTSIFIQLIHFVSRSHILHRVRGAFITTSLRV